jgi:flagellar hook-associated protein 1
MPSTFFGLNIGTTGLYTYQAALNTTAHNISNTETAGYTRQVLNQKAGVAIKVNSTYGMAGSGVDVSGVVQIRNQYYDMKLWKNTTTYGNYAAKEHYMTEIETYFNEINLEGFTTSFNSLHNSLQELSKDPSSLSVRKQVTNYAKSLTDYFNYLSTSMSGIQEECNFEVKNTVDQINSLGQQIASLTKQINSLESTGGIANDLRDQRNLLLDELSGITTISTNERIVGDAVGITSFTVKIDGQTLVDTAEFNTLKVVPRTEKMNQNDIEGLYDIVWANGQTFNPLSSTTSGSLKALFEVRDGNNKENLQGRVTAAAGETSVVLKDTNINTTNKLNIPSSGIITIGNREYKYNSFTATFDATTKKYSYEFQLDDPLTVGVTNEGTSIGDSIDYKGIPYYMAQMNEFVRTYSKSFNDIHKQAQDLDGNTGIDFFNGKDPVTGNNYSFDTDEKYYLLTAANFTVTEAIYSDPSKLAVSTKITDGVENKTYLDKLIALKSDKTMFKQGAPASFLQTLVAEIGIDTDKAASFAKSQSDIVYMINNQRLSESGVDIDEEAMNLVKFQNAYNLSAKAITVMNEIYDKLINGTGV